MKQTILTFTLFLLACVTSVNAQIKYSNGSDEFWYNLLSAKSGVENLAITESADAVFPISMAALEENDESQQWKFVEDASTGNIYIINRKSGNQILSDSRAEGIYNATLIGLDSLNRGFKVALVGDGQYSFSAIESDGIERYLAIQELSAEGVVLDEENIGGSAFAWVAQEIIPTGVEEISAEEFVISVTADRRIIVENATDYKVTTLAGIELRKDASLEKGVYIVTVGSVSKKVSIE
ncbi:MAG: hypothetical protein IKC70_05790 [Bacteroidaceae bacterium]|nr:hypothetical protein [Bacteroidaceae bacterium]